MEELPAARLCLPTGSTPKPVYELAAEWIDLSRAEVFVLDEFGLPPTDPSRCDAMLRADLLDRLAKPPHTIETLNPQALDLGVECTRFACRVDDGGLDLTMLGLGENGHLGLNEPGSDPQSATRRVDLHRATVQAAARYGPATQPAWGLTLGLREILASRRIWLLVTGAHKAQILERVLTGPIGPDVPASYLREHPNTVILADESAAAGIRPS